MKNNFKKGITIVELIVVIFILSTAFLAVIEALSLGNKIANSSQQATVAVSLSQEKLEEELSESYGDLSVGTTTEDFGTVSGFSAYKRITKINCVQSSDLAERDCNYDPANNPDPAKKIEVLVFWKSALGLSEKSVKLAALVSKK